ncbi:hypothetical protein GALMADRAFT_149121 [Galerina marginata CBS 339.88]|uniref:Uncharacterized protein n=1 Tax=Galerina marginata (strain CBS 339.88) TaxID=685588 RepID=A0A067S2H9_GALM3|nr:hypothetical protein GALMADRAFT_149121 [Galerina marginata CBS 339.88]
MILFEQELHGNGDGIGDEEPPVDLEDDDEIAGDVATSDVLAVDEAIRETEESLRAPAKKIVDSPAIRADLENAADR